MTTPTITINTIDNGTNVITAADAASGVTWSGSETGLDGQQIGVEFDKSYGNSRFEGSAFSPVVGENGTWGTVARPGGFPFDGIYTAHAHALGATDATETFIVAEHATAFEVVGMAFIDVSQQLLPKEPFIVSIGQELIAEKAGLQTLLEYDAFPAKPLNELIKDIDKELMAIDFTPQTVGVAFADSKMIAKVEHIQDQMTSLVQGTPALVAQQPDGIGWNFSG